MKRFFLVLICFALLLPLFAMTYYVSQDGTADFTTIQEAIDFSSDTDYIIVHPGRYIEQVNTNGKQLVLASMYLYDPNPDYIENTVIDGYWQSCITVENNETVHINGFTLTNNEHEPNTGYDLTIGGGVCVKEDSNVTISNCIIRNCTANYGGGIGVGRGDGRVEISSLQIYNNQAFYRGGGIFVDTDFEFIFNSENLCSVFDNNAANGMDIMLFDWDEDETFPTIDINLDICSRAIEEPDQFFIATMYALAEIDIQNSYFGEIDSDIYVSPLGDDGYSGINPAEPFQTLKKALQMITVNPDNPRTIHLAPGGYSQTLNNQVFPLAAKSNVSIIGEGPEQTILDAEESASFFGILYSENINISGLSLNNSEQRGISAVIECIESSNLFYNDIIINNFESTCFNIARSSNIYFTNCIFETEPTDSNSPRSIMANDCDNVIVNGYISNNFIITNIDYNEVGVLFQESDLNISNAIFTGCEADDGVIFSFQNALYPESTRRLIMKNCLFFDNDVDTWHWTFAPVYIQDRYQTPIVTNCTFANNSGNSYFVYIIGEVELSNSIFYNPSCYGELYLKNRYENIFVNPPVTVIEDVYVNNCSFSSSQPSSTIPEQVYFTDCLYNTDPLFLGSLTDTLSIEDIDYYQLSANSPCIDSGTVDTLGLYLPDTDLAGGQRVWNDIVDMGVFEYGAPVSIQDETNLVPPTHIRHSVYPNPINLVKGLSSFVNIEFSLPKKPIERPTLEIYNIRGQKVRDIKITQSFSQLVRSAGLSSEDKQSGEYYSQVWDCKDNNRKPVAAGIYFYKVSCEGNEAIGKMMVVK